MGRSLPERWQLLDRSRNHRRHKPRHRRHNLDVDRDLPERTVHVIGRSWRDMLSIKLASDRSGVVAIEFALILPIMLIIFLAAMRLPTSSSPISSWRTRPRRQLIWSPRPRST